MPPLAENKVILGDYEGMMMVYNTQKRPYAGCQGVSGIGGFQ